MSRPSLPGQTGFQRIKSRKGRPFMSNLERKFGKYAIRNLSLVLIVCYMIGYILYFINPSILYYLSLDPYRILHGQIWRLFSWILIPPMQSGLFFILIMLYFYYSIGTTLERVWGTWEYNVYIFSGMFFTVVGAFLAMGIMRLLYPQAGSGTYELLSRYFTTYYVNMSIFLAYAATFPDAQVLLMFFIPIRVKWLGIIYGVIVLFDVFQSPLPIKVAVIASLLNFVIFWFRSRKMRRFRPDEILRRNRFKKAVSGNAYRPAGTDPKMRPSGQTAGNGRVSSIHRCTICGRTELDSPDLEFRYCSRCAGLHEYCSDHLFTHVHITEEGK